MTAHQYGPLAPAPEVHNGSRITENATPGTVADAKVAAEARSDLADLARTLQHLRTPQDVMDAIVTNAVAMIDGARHCSISLVKGRRLVVSAAATDDVARAFDTLQNELSEGPCLSAMYESPVVLVGDLTREERWPQLAARAPELGVHSMLCFQLFVHGIDLGGLNLLAGPSDAFGEDAISLGTVFATHAAVALADAQKLDDLTAALTNRDVIGQAKGILMERFRLTADDAFSLLARISQDRNVKLHRVAEELASTGSLAS